VNTTGLKHSQVFVFDDGTLTIKMSGHGGADGWGTLSFPEHQVQIEDGYHAIDIPPTELRALRDFLNLVMPK
jgi:hypothetical protein